MRGIAAFLVILCFALPFTYGCCSYDLIDGNAGTRTWTYLVTLQSSSGRYLCRSGNPPAPGPAALTQADSVDDGNWEVGYRLESASAAIPDATTPVNLCYWALRYLGGTKDVAFHGIAPNNVIEPFQLYARVCTIDADGANRRDPFSWTCAHTDNTDTEMPLFFYGHTGATDRFNIQMSSGARQDVLNQDGHVVEFRKSGGGQLLMIDWRACLGSNPGDEAGLATMSFAKMTSTATATSGCNIVGDAEARSAPGRWTMRPVFQSQNYRFGLHKGTSDAETSVPTFAGDGYVLNRFAWPEVEDNDVQGDANTIANIVGNDGEALSQARPAFQIPVRYTGTLETNQGEDWFHFTTNSLYPNDANTNNFPTYNRNVRLTLHREGANVGDDGCNLDISYQFYRQDTLGSTAVSLASKSVAYLPCADIILEIPQFQLPSAANNGLLGAGQFYNYYIRIFHNEPVDTQNAESYTFSISHDYCYAPNPCTSISVAPFPPVVCSSVGQLRRCSCAPGYLVAQQAASDDSVWPSHTLPLTGTPAFQTSDYTRTMAGFPHSFYWDRFNSFLRRVNGIDSGAAGFNDRFWSSSLFYPGQHILNDQLRCINANECDATFLSSFGGVGPAPNEATCTEEGVNARRMTCPPGMRIGCTGEPSIVLIGHETFAPECYCEDEAPLNGCCGAFDYGVGAAYQLGGGI